MLHTFRMASVAPTFLPIVITTRLETSQDKTIKVEDFLRGLKRPGPKLAQATVSPTIKDHDDPLFATASCDGTLSTGLIAKDQSSSLPDPRQVDEAPSVSGLRKPYAYKSKESEPLQHLCSSTRAERSKAKETSTFDNVVDLLDPPEIVRTYGNKDDKSTPHIGNPPNDSHLFYAHPSTEEKKLVCSRLMPAFQGQQTVLHSNESGVSHNLGLKELQDSAQHKDHASQNAIQQHARLPPPDVTAEQRSRERRKKRRATVNDLALSSELPLYAGSPDMAEVIHYAYAVSDSLRNQTG